MDFSRPRIIAEFGPGEGCHTREIARHLTPESRLLLFELDPEFAQHLANQFRHDARVTVLNIDAAHLTEALAARGLRHCDYVVSGIPFSILDPEKKRELLRRTYEALAPAPMPRSSFTRSPTNARARPLRPFRARRERILSCRICRRCSSPNSGAQPTGMRAPSMVAGTV
jgi:phospholipid N-methyltransferase